MGAVTMVGVDEPRWYRADVARYLGVNQDTLVRLGLPARDGSEVDRHYIRPWWYRATIVDWNNARPGRGAPGRPKPRRRTT